MESLNLDRIISLTSLAVTSMIAVVAIWATMIASEPPEVKARAKAAMLGHGLGAALLVGVVLSAVLWFNGSFGLSTGVAAFVCVAYGALYCLGAGPARRVDTATLVFLVGWALWVALSGFILRIMKVLGA